MIAPNSNLLCKQAEQYYYDFLCDENRGLIPESIFNHIEQCQQCREQTNKLKAALSHADDLESEQEQARSTVTAMLKLHFDYIGKPVTCNIVKPFLPCLLDPALEIRIPTPIIAHLHNCRQCSEDLDIIRCLNLNRKQLCRLSQLFAEKPAGDKLFKERQQIFENLPEDAASPEFPCESVSAGDIFDYVVPYGLDPANGQYAKFRESFTSHAATCPNCLAKIRQLQKTIYHIAERAESDVVTIYHIDESAKTEARSESDDIYAGFPIRVETATREGEVNSGRPASVIAFGAALKQKVSAMNPKSLAKSAAAAAAVILIGVALFLSTRTAGAVTIDQIYRALERVKNVHISRDEPMQEKWVSRSLDYYLTKTKEGLVLSDIPNGVRRSKQHGTTVIDTEPLNKDDVAYIEEKMSGSLGLTPFYDISEVPRDSEWSRVTDVVLEGVSEGTEVYDLTWVVGKRVGFVVFRKWRFFVDPETNRPEKTEFYEKLSADSEDDLVFRMVIEYLDDSEIRTVIKDFGF
jgi:hypothetical protein